MTNLIYQSAAHHKWKCQKREREIPEWAHLHGWHLHTADKS